MKSILLVDDMALARDAYALLLEWSGYRVLVADNGQQACEIAREEHPDMIVMDLTMPVLDGWEAARRLKADARTADIPLIALSAILLDPEECRRLEECGFEAAWTKPLPPSSLLEEICRRCGSAEQVAQGSPTEARAAASGRLATAPAPPSPPGGRPHAPTLSSGPRSRAARPSGRA